MTALTNSERPRRAKPASVTVWTLFFLSIAVYAATRLIAIEDFPIYFFCDEAVHSVDFRDLVAHHFRGLDAPNEWLPAYFRNGRMLNLSLSVYLQGIASYIGGQSVSTVRATSTLASLSGAIALALLLRNIFRAREWWSVIAFLTVMAGLFLHSRTGFECTLMFSSYCWFLYFYLRYREGNLRSIFAAMLFGAATFYSYSPGQGLMLVTGLFAAAFDFRYHWANRRWSGAGLCFALLLFAPYVRFRILHPQMLNEHLAEIHSYWVQPLPLATKLMAFSREYLKGLNPRYWFAVPSVEGLRHIVPFNGFIPWPLAPFAFGGLFICLLQWRHAAHRMMIVALLASAFSGGLASGGITRNLAFLVSAAVFIALAFDWLMGQIHTIVARELVRLSSFGLLSAAGFFLLFDALTFGPIQVPAYDLYGLQYGSQAVFRDLIPRYLKSNPEANIFMSHTWSNSPEVFPKFFGWNDRRRAYFLSLEDIELGSFLPRDRDFVLLTAYEYQMLPNSKCIERFDVVERVPYPDGKTGFYFGHLHLRPDFVARMRAGSWDRLNPKFVRLLADRIPTAVFINQLASGDLNDLFSPAPHAPLRGGKGAHVQIEIYFEEPIALRQIEIDHQKGLVYDQLVRVLDGAVVRKDQSGRIDGTLARTVIPLGDEKVDHLQVELHPDQTEAAGLERIRVVPAGP